MAGCLARSDCKERDILAINQGLQSALKKHFQSTLQKHLLSSVPLEGAMNNQAIDFILCMQKV